MMRKFLFILFLGTVQSSEAEGFRCEELFTVKSTSPLENAISRTFAEVFRSKSVYRCLECHLNVKRFFNRLRTNYPKYDFSEIKVLYITHQKMPFDSSPEVGFHIKRARGSAQHGESSEFVFWNFHVVIEFRGKIYDFDYTESPTTLPLRDYVREFFLTAKEVEQLAHEYNLDLEGPTNELIVYAIPGSQYFHYKNQQVNTWDFHLSLFTNYPSVPLLSYVNPN